MSQPDWKLLANLGDVCAVDHGGYFLYADATGEHPPEAELLERDNDRDDSTFTIHRVTLGKCKVVSVVDDEDPSVVRSYLVPLAYDPSWPHPVASYVEWFANDLPKVADTMGTTTEELRGDLCSDDPIKRAGAYRYIGDYHGWANLDSYPLTGVKNYSSTRT